MLLNRLNPLKGLSEEQRKAFIAEFRHKSEAFGNRDLRLRLMDEQGIDKALMFPAAAHDIEYEFADNIQALYANIRAFNRWMHEEVGYVVDNRMFLPPYIALADPDLAVKELETGHRRRRHHDPDQVRTRPRRALTTPSVVVPRPTRSTTGSGRIVNEAGIRLAVHLGGTDYQKYGADWSEDPTAVFGDFDAFQWMMYWGDRPAMELTAGLILHNFFGRFPNIKVCLSEMGTVWLPYTLRKMDHAFLMGRKAKWSATGRLDRRPSEIFRQHFIVAPLTPKRTCDASSTRSASNPSSSARTSPTAKVWPIRPLCRRPTHQLHRRRTAQDHARQPRELPHLALTPRGLAVSPLSTRGELGPMTASANRGMFDMVERAPDDLTLIDPHGRLTWNEVSRRICDAAQGLLEIGFQNGRLAVLGSNCAATVIAYASARLAGVGVILVNCHSTADEVSYLLVDGGTTANTGRRRTVSRLRARSSETSRHSCPL